MKGEKQEMKKRLWAWGQAEERFGWKEEELENLLKYQEMERKIRRGQSAEEKEQEYADREKTLRLELMDILREKEDMDRYIGKLTGEEETFVHMRFEKGYVFDYIGMKLHRSRATLFRMQDRILEKLICFEKERF